MPTPSQTNPLDAFYNASGATGNKTTNADLPQWLKDLGMKGDAYAGGMLKPELRYGFKYKDGKINFADGTSFAAKKQKDGSYSYTDASGAAQSYSPTDEQNAYNKKYQASTSNQGVFDKVKNTAGFELWHGGQILKGIKPSQVFFGIDPLGTKIGNAVTGAHAKPLVDQMGGALDSRYAEYGKPTGYAEPLQGVAHAIASTMGGQGLGGALGHIGGAIGGKAGGALASLGTHTSVLSNAISMGNDAVSPHAPAPGDVDPDTGMPVGPAGANPFGNLGTGQESDQALDPSQFPKSGFRDDNAFNYLLQSLNLPSPGGAQQGAGTPMAAPPASPGYAPPAGLQAFSGMDFSSMFGPLVGGGKFGLPSPVANPYAMSSPKTPPSGYTAVDSGTRGPSPDPTSLQAKFAGAFGNGGAAFGTKSIPSNPLTKLPRAWS